MKINVDFIYPIGSVYISTQSTNPSVLFGGKWVQTAKSRAIVGAGSNIANTDTTYGTLAAGSLNLTAGELMGEPTHTLSVNEMPAHKHTLWFTGTSSDVGTPHYHNFGEGIAFGINNQRKYGRNDMIDDAGGGQGHNNIMPIEVYYIWKRVS